MDVPNVEGDPATSTIYNDGLNIEEPNSNNTEGQSSVVAEVGEDAIDTKFHTRTSLLQNIICLICGSGCLVELEVESSTDKDLFKKLCLLLKLSLKTNVDYWSSGKECAPFCSSCKNQVAFLADLQQKLIEIEEDFRNGLKEFKRLCKDGECAVEASGIYAEDLRYYRLRRQFWKNAGRKGKKNRVESIEVKVEPVIALPPRRSLRGPKSIRTKCLSALSTFSPVVRMSELDKAKADKLLDVKIEVMSDLEIDYNEAAAAESPTNWGNDFDFVISGTTSLKQQNKKKKKVKTKGKIKAKQKSKKLKSSPINNVPRRTRERKIIFKDDDFDYDMLDGGDDVYGDCDDDVYVGMDPPKKGTKPGKRRKKDVDYQPDIEEEKMYEDDIDDEDFLDQQRIRSDRASGSCSFLHVKFEPLNDGSDKYTCKECDEVVAKSMIRKHTFKYHSTRFKCKECDSCYPGPRELEIHVRSAHRNEKLVTECPICAKPVSGNVKSRLLRHITTHYSEQDRKEALERGEKLATWKDRKFNAVQCDSCGKKFKTKAQLENHVINYHPNPEDADEVKFSNKELCPECGKVVSKAGMKSHMLRSHNVTRDANLTVGAARQNPEAAKRFICTYCDKRFHKSIELVRHKMGVHEKNYPFQCSLCPRSFLLQRQLKNHMNTHNNIRNYACKFCPSSFFTNGNLTRHVSTFHVDGANPKRKAYVRGAQSKNKKTSRDVKQQGPDSEIDLKLSEKSLSTTHQAVDFSKAQMAMSSTSGQNEISMHLHPLASAASISQGSSSTLFLQEFFRQN